MERSYRNFFGLGIPFGGLEILGILILLAGEEATPEAAEIPEFQSLSSN
jgi:hypothetical protein